MVSLTIDGKPLTVDVVFDEIWFSDPAIYEESKTSNTREDPTVGLEPSVDCHVVKCWSHTATWQCMGDLVGNAKL
ncbi:hypothetical protein FEM48_Zijuj07G0012600 [Ziziphus jujuba var. spinosa]|uniref:Uncharacterized protein n=1 Tax=Ziziphus jujuba var. spinosa TaxID=714518 RepID=A0A978V1L2_ZIZJJ|nr:hypothetical protein FEM48_Zijuj07G0012600 [Ziziphus jujuba var. spinosa]